MSTTKRSLEIDRIKIDRSGDDWFALIWTDQLTPAELSILGLLGDQRNRRLEVTGQVEITGSGREGHDPASSDPIEVSPGALLTVYGPEGSGKQVSIRLETLDLETNHRIAKALVSQFPYSGYMEDLKQARAEQKEDR